MMILARLTDYYQKFITKNELTFSEDQFALAEALQPLFELRSQPHRFWKKRPTRTYGAYIHGDVGRGKTVVMKLFMGTMPDPEKVHYVHFHAFMTGVHQFLHKERQKMSGNATMDKALDRYATEVSKRFDLLCFDEFHVTDVADAMILKRLFTSLIDKKLTILLTSNFAPDRLYEGGLQRELFVPFIDFLKDKLLIWEMTGQVDFRRENEEKKGRGGFYRHPVKPQDRTLVEGVRVHKIGGRNITLKMVGRDGTAHFAHLCDQHLGASDYLALAEKLDHLTLIDVPAMGYDRRNEAKRFMMLIDIFYDQGRGMSFVAEAAPDELYFGPDYAFEFQRTVSRIIEMTR